MKYAIIAIWAVSIAIVSSAVPTRAEAGEVRCVIASPSCGWIAVETDTTAQPAGTRG